MRNAQSDSITTIWKRHKTSASSFNICAHTELSVATRAVHRCGHVYVSVRACIAVVDLSFYSSRLFVFVAYFVVLFLPLCFFDYLWLFSQCSEVFFSFLVHLYPWLCKEWKNWWTFWTLSYGIMFKLIFSFSFSVKSRLFYCSCT